MSNFNLSGDQLLYLVVALTVALVVALVAFFVAFSRAPAELRQLVADGAYLQNLTVILVVLVAGGLTLAGKLSSELAATLLSGITGYVLGGVKRKDATGS